MTVSSSVAKAGPYVGNGSTKIFAYSFRILDDEHVLVTRQLEDGTIETVAPSEYTVDGVGNPSGNVTFTIAPASGIKITIIRNVPLTQDLDLENEGPYLADDIEASFDKAMMIDQQQQEELDRAIRAPAGDTATSMELPPVADRSGKTLAFDASGNPIAGELTTEGVSAIADAVSDDRLLAEAAATEATVQASAAADSADDAAAQAAAAAQSLASITDVVLSASPTVNTFVGTGVQTSFTLSVQDPPAESTFVYINGVYQNKSGVYSLSGFSINFVVAPANLAVIEVITGGFTTIATTTIGGVTGLQAALDAKLALTGGTLSGPLQFPNGSNTLPAIARSASPSTGFFFGASMVSFSAAGVETMRLDTASMRLGYPAGVSAGSQTPQVQAHDTDGDAGFGAFRWSSDANGPRFSYGKARSGTMGTMTAVQSGDVLGEDVWYGADGTNFQPAAMTRVVVGATPGANDMPGEWQLYTTPDGSVSLTHRVKVDSNGKMVLNDSAATVAQSVSSATPQLQVLGADTAKSSILVGRNAADTAGSGIFGYKSRNTTIGSHTIVQNNDFLLVVAAYGSDGANYVPAAGIYFQVGGTPGTNDMPGRISFRTTADGASSSTERYTVEPDGTIDVKSGVLRLPTGGDAGLASTTHPFQIGPSASPNLIIDANEIQTRNNGASATLSLNLSGGAVSCGATLATQSGVTIIDGQLNATRDAGIPGAFNRNTSDGVLVQFLRDSSNVGDIRVTTGTVTLTAFTAGHWTFMADEEDIPQLLLGTIVETVNELLEWPEEPVYKTVLATEAFTNEAGEVVPKGTPLQVFDRMHQPIEDRLSKCVISRTPGSKAVYGVYSMTDDDGTITVNSVGAFWVRIQAGQTPELGDLIESAGDGTGRVQSDDIVRSKTVAKITSLVVKETYEDGSFVLPCTLHCG